MLFEWDKKKDRLNLAKHKISFSEAKEVFSHQRIKWHDTRKDYGEKRLITIGTIAPQIVIIVAYTTRNKHIRLISARKANKKETRRFYELI